MNLQVSSYLMNVKELLEAVPGKWVPIYCGEITVTRYSKI